jgi:hypothetical protein
MRTNSLCAPFSASMHPLYPHASSPHSAGSVRATREDYADSDHVLVRLCTFGRHLASSPPTFGARSMTTLQGAHGAQGRENAFYTPCWARRARAADSAIYVPCRHSLVVNDADPDTTQRADAALSPVQSRPDKRI